jgi:hypothetical protein
MNDKHFNYKSRSCTNKYIQLCFNTSTIHHNQSLLLKTTQFFLYITYTDSNQQKTSYYYEKEIFANKLHQIFD